MKEQNPNKGKPSKPPVDKVKPGAKPTTTSESKSEGGSGAPSVSAQDMLDAQFPTPQNTTIVSPGAITSVTPVAATNDVAVLDESPTATQMLDAQYPSPTQGDFSLGDYPQFGGAAAEAVTTPRSAMEDPGFMALSTAMSATAKSQTKHEPAASASQQAQQAAPSPANERASTAQASQVDVMDAQETGAFSAADFKAQLQSRIDAMQLPANEEEADNFAENNNIDQVQSAAMSDVSTAQANASGGIATATQAAPDTASVPARAVGAMPTPSYGKAPATIPAAKAVPPKRPAAAVEQPIQAQTASMDAEMQTHGVTDSMLANANEPSFKQALDEKNAAKANSEAATTQFRSSEDAQLSAAEQQTQQQTDAATSGMHASRVVGLGKVAGDQQQSASKNTAERKAVADKIESFYQTTKTQVNTILTELDTAVAAKFVAGAKAAQKAFEDHIATKMAAYKKERYGDSWFDIRQLRRVGDAIVGLPEEVNAFFESGREKYIATMDTYITAIAELVAKELNRAKQTIKDGKQQVQNYVQSLSPNLQKIGEQAAQEIQGKFDSLEQEVDNKKDALIDTLAQQYAAQLEQVDSEIEALKAANSGLVGKAMSALKGVFDVIITIKNTLTNLLASVISVVGAIIADPIGFLKNLMTGVGQGLSNFMTNILQHLKTGFIGWLTGAMQGITFTMPENIFSLKGIFSVVMQVLGLTWQGIRAIGAKVIGEPVMKVIETGVEVVQVIRKDGIAGLWEYIKEKFQDLKSMVMDAIMNIIQTQVIQAGVKWILGLLSPVGAFIKAAMAIVDVVKFFIQRASQIIELVNAFTQSMAAIASGKVGAVAKAIEDALGKAIPVLIGFLASLLGLGGIADKVLGIIRKIRQRIVKAITSFWQKIKRGAGKLLRKLGIGKKKKKGKDEKGQIDDFEDIKEPFKAEDNNTHNLYFDTVGGKTVLMIASTPQNFEDFVNSIEVKSTDERTEKAKKKAVVLAKKIDKRKTDETKGDKVKEKKKANDIRAMVKALSKFAGILFGIDKNGLPETEVVYLSKPFKGSVLGTGMRATVLTRNGADKGSEPKETNSIYEKLFNRLDGGRAYYVRGHLLNHHIGGPGTLKNLTPLSQEGNKNHLRVAEEPIKIAVLGGAIVDYILSVRYGLSVPDVSDQQLEAAGFETEKQKETIRKIRENEKYLPNGLSLRSHYLKKENGKYVRDKVIVNATSVLNPVDLSLNSYKINEDRKEKISIVNSSVEDISANTPFNNSDASIIKDIIKALKKEKKRVSWNEILKIGKLILSNTQYNKIKEIIDNKSKTLKNVKIN